MEKSELKHYIFKRFDHIVDKNYDYFTSYRHERLFGKMKLDRSDLIWKALELLIVKISKEMHVFCESAEDNLKFEGEEYRQIAAISPKEVVHISYDIKPEERVHNICITSLSYENTDYSILDKLDHVVIEATHYCENGPIKKSMNVFDMFDRFSLIYK